LFQPKRRKEGGGKQGRRIVSRRMKVRRVCWRREKGLEKFCWKATAFLVNGEKRRRKIFCFGGGVSEGKGTGCVGVEKGAKFCAASLSRGRLVLPFLQIG